MYQMGIDPTTASSTPLYDLGQVAFNVTSDGIKGYIYVQDSGSGVTAAGYVVDINGATGAAVMSTTTTTAPGTGAGKIVGVSPLAVTASYYYWAQIFGPCVVRVAASCAAFTIINSTATAGQLDDDATAGAEVIDGLVLTTANGGAAATAAAYANWPKIGRTL